MTESNAAARDISADDRAFLAAFEAAAIPPERWTHRAHIRMAYLYLRDHPFDEALGRIRSGIRALNRANGVRSTPAGGYHETVTVAWARVVASCIAYHGGHDGADRGGAGDFAMFADANPHLFAKTLLRLYYTRERLLQPEARTGLVEPDVAPLPRTPA